MLISVRPPFTLRGQPRVSAAPGWGTPRPAAPCQGCAEDLDAVAASWQRFVLENDADASYDNRQDGACFRRCFGGQIGRFVMYLGMPLVSSE